MQFMTISIGILALVCAFVILFGAQRARKILGWTFGIVIVGAVALGALWAWSMFKPEPVFDPAKLEAAIKDNASDWMAVPVNILPALPEGFELEDKSPSVADKIQVTGPDKRIFLFAAGTSNAAIDKYMQYTFGAPGTPRGKCWTEEPGAWCYYR